ncbi:uncharacterized mitochondrial protein-like protein [Tanacetum coccineum]
MAMADSAGIEAMQDCELHQFDRLKVWGIVDKPFGQDDNKAKSAAPDFRCPAPAHKSFQSISWDVDIGPFRIGPLKEEGLCCSTVRVRCIQIHPEKSLFLLRFVWKNPFDQSDYRSKKSGHSVLGTSSRTRLSASSMAIRCSLSSTSTQKHSRSIFRPESLPDVLYSEKHFGGIQFLVIKNCKLAAKENKNCTAMSSAEAVHSNLMQPVTTLSGQSTSILALPEDRLVILSERIGMSYEMFDLAELEVEKVLYGLHQAPRAWYKTLSTYLLDNGFQRRTIDKTLFIKRHKGDILLVQVYVDGIIFGLTKKELCIAFEKLMHENFQVSSMGELIFFLGLQVQQKKGGIFISQDKYVEEILKKFGFTDVKTASTPMETQKPLLKDKNGKEVDVHMYRSMIGSLMYLTSSRPDIMYLKGQPKLGLWYPKDSPFHLVAYTDSDYAGASLDRKSTIGGCQFLGCRLISWQCKK